MQPSEGAAFKWDTATEINSKYEIKNNVSLTVMWKLNIPSNCFFINVNVSKCKFYSYLWAEIYVYVEHSCLSLSL